MDRHSLAGDRVEHVELPAHAALELLGCVEQQINGNQNGVENTREEFAAFEAGKLGLHDDHEVEVRAAVRLAASPGSEQDRTLGARRLERSAQALGEFHEREARGRAENYDFVAHSAVSL